jgi:hypothetical protein
LKITDIIHARGHENVTSTNKTTFEITKETHLTKRGDCIIAVSATKGARNLSPEFKQKARNKHARIRIEIKAGNKVETVNARGDPNLTFTDSQDLVIRKSEYVCGRTLAVLADKVAKDFSRAFVEELRNSSQEVKITLTVDNPI